MVTEQELATPTNQRRYIARRFFLVTLVALMSLAGVDISAAVSDASGPSLVALAATPAVVDVGASSKSVKITARFTDDVTGVRLASAGYPVLLSPGNSVAFGSWWSLVSGNSHDGVFESTITIPAYSATGFWKYQIRVFDEVGNLTGYDAPDLTAMGLPAGIDVTAAETPGHALSYVAGTGGTILGQSSQTVSDGGSGAAVTAIPNAGYRFVDWSDGSTQNPRMDTNVRSDIRATANFALNAYTLAYSAGTGGTISGPSPQTVNHGANGTSVTAVPNVGHHFVEWSDGIATAVRADTAVTEDKSVSAVFGINTYTLAYHAATGGTISGSVTQTVDFGTTGSEVRAVPDAHYRFLRWSDGSTANPRTDASVSADESATALFAKLVTRAMIVRTPNASRLTYSRRNGVTKFSLAATIRGWAGAPIGRQYVYLQTSANGRTWKNTYRLMTTATGRASETLAIRSAQTLHYRWYVPAKAQVNLATFSAPTRVMVK